MKRIALIFVISLLIAFQGILFTRVEANKPSGNYVLTHSLPSEIYEVSFGFLKQIVAEFLFVDSAIFLGGLRHGHDKDYGSTLANNYETIVELNPHFLDPYFFTQSFLATLSTEYAKIANKILEHGIKHNPNDMILRFYYATNYMIHLEDYQNASRAFLEASKIPDSPKLFGNLAASLSAKGGNIHAGIIMLKTLLRSETEENIIKGYRRDLEIFTRAQQIQLAVDKYFKDNRSYPEDLNMIVPFYTPSLETEYFDDKGYKIEYVDGTISLLKVRPTR